MASSLIDLGLMKMMNPLSLSEHSILMAASRVSAIFETFSGLSPLTQTWTAGRMNPMVILNSLRLKRVD